MNLSKGLNLVVTLLAAFAIACGGGNGDDGEEEPDIVEQVDDKPPIPADCLEASTQFEACGGDVIGTWKMTTMCMDEEEGFENPFAEQCPESTLDADIFVDATFTFDETTLTTDFVEMKVDMTLTIPNDCLGIPGPTCDGLNQDQNEMDCAEEGDNCICVAVLEGDTADPPEVNTYVKEGNELVVTDPEGKVDNIPYCINGDKGVVKSTEEDEGKTEIVYFIIEKL